MATLTALECAKQVANAIDSGKAKDLLERLIDVSHR